jgi:hypothetical protein
MVMCLLSLSTALTATADAAVVLAASAAAGLQHGYRQGFGSLYWGFVPFIIESFPCKCCHGWVVLRKSIQQWSFVVLL